ncbi:hypothetical protein EDD85DRAFT_958616 [Armillaria nabsnona]|nr:hypothetical protein EDD85DRAFT_958616 [Armillaria nabsnona]
MLNGESMCEILLEYIEGTTHAQFKDKYPSHASPQFHTFPKESYTKWLEIAKVLYIPALRGMSTITNHGVVHHDLKTQNIMIMPTSPWRVMYIDIAFSALRVPQH